MKPLSHRVLSISLSAIKAMEREARGQKGVISMAQGIPSFPTPAGIASQVARSISNGESSYYTIPEGRLSLRKLVSSHVEDQSGMRYQPQGEVMVTAGAMAAIQASLLTLLNPGDEVLVIGPAYASYYGQIITAGGVPRHVPLDSQNNFRLDLSQLKRQINSRSKAILFANPSNPTGTNFTCRELKGLVEVARERDLYIISDEVYRDFIWEGEHICAASFEEIRDRLLLVFGFSKAYAMTGYRVGYLCGPEKILDQILKIHDNLVTCAPHPAQVAAEAALREPASELNKRLEAIRENRDWALDRLEELPFLHCHTPQGAYYLFARIDRGQVDSLSFCQYLLREAKVATVPGIAFGPMGEGYLRICYAVDGGQMEKAFDRLQQLWQEGIDFRQFSLRRSYRKSA